MEVYSPIHRNREEVLVVSSDEEDDYKDADEEVSSDEDFEDAEEASVSAASSEDEEVSDPEVILQDLIGLSVDQVADDDGLSNMPRESLRGSASPEPDIQVVTNLQESERDNLSDAETVVVTIDDLLTAKLENDKAKKIEKKEEDDEEKEEEKDRVPLKVDHHFIPDEELTELTVQVKVAYEEDGASGGGNGKAPEPGKIKTEDDKLVSRDFKHLLIGKDPKVEVGQYSCYCGKDYNSRTDFKKHLNDVNQVFLEYRGQHCRICGMEFGLKDEETRKLEGCFGCRFMWDIPEGGSRMRDRNEFQDVTGAQRRKTRKPAKRND